MSCFDMKEKSEAETEIMKNQKSQSNWWWLDINTTVKRSPWLQSTITELNEKTKAMLKLIEEDADSFAKRAEMYYKKRPELLSMVEDFYRTHRLLAERYDQVKPETGNRVLKTVESPFPSLKNYQSDKFIGFEDHSYDSYSENCDVEESVESEIEDPVQEEAEEIVKLVNNNEQEKVRFAAGNDGVMKMKKEFELLSEKNKGHKDQIKQKDNISEELVILRDEIERLRKENIAQKDELKQKDTIYAEVMMLREEIERVRKENKTLKDDLKQKDKEKIDVIKQLSVTIDVLKQEYVKMRSFIAKESTKKWKTPFDFNKIIAFSEKLFNGTPRNQQPSVVPL